MKKVFLIPFLVLGLFGCGNKKGVNVSETQKPRLMVIPSDQLLQKYGALIQENVNGKTIQVRDFSKYLLNDENSKFIIAAIQQIFIDYGFPCNDLEQTLKSINDQNMLDDIDGIQKDVKTMLLTSAKPDIIFELDYDLKSNFVKRGSVEKSITYSIKAIDAFSNKVVATIQQAEFGKDSKENSATKLMEMALATTGKDFSKQIDNYFGEIIELGRDITVRITIEGDVNLTMSDECLGGDTYTDYIIDYMKVNTVQGAYTMARNTNTELYFTNVRIKTLNENGTQFSAYDFARALAKDLNKGCGVKSSNKTQGLGDALISIKGM